MTIWHNKDEMPESGNNLVFKSEIDTYHVAVCEDNGQVSMYDDSNVFTNTPPLPKMVSWCYLDDLLGLEQRLKEAEDVITTIRNQCNFLKPKEGYMSCGTLINNLTISLYNYTQEYLNKYGVKNDPKRKI